MSRVDSIPKLMLNAERGSVGVSAVLRTPRAVWTSVEWVQMQRELDQEYITSGIFHIYAAHAWLTLVCNFVLQATPPILN